MDKDSILSVPTRKRIYETIEASPGCHLRDLARKNDLPLGTTLYHLDYLESKNVVTVRRDGRYKRYFMSESDLGDLQQYSLLKRDAPKRIYEYLWMNPGATQDAMIEGLGLGRSTISFHLINLVNLELVERFSLDKKSRYIARSIKPSA